MIYTSSVKKGYGRGKKMDSPTFNLDVPLLFDYKYGVYAARVWLKGKMFAGALHFGPIPTFDQEEPVIEIFVLDYDGDQLIRNIDFEILKFLRQIRKFANEDELKAQIRDDVVKIRDILSF